MNCLYCNSKTSVSNSRSSGVNKTVWRRRACISCAAIFTTREYIELESSLMVANDSKHLAPFNRDKLLISIYTSLTHRSKALQEAQGITETIISHLLKSNHKGVLTTSSIARNAYEILKRFDKAAATFYQAHHPNLS